MKRLIDLYPRRWRERYGGELAEFVTRRGAGLYTAVDLIRGAIDAHLHPEVVGDRSTAMTPGTAPPDDLVFVPRKGFRSVHALGTRANVVVEKDGRTLTAAITPDRDGIRLEFTVTGIAMELGTGGQRFEDPVRISDDQGRDISTPRPRWQVGGSFMRTADGTVMLRYTTLLEPLARGVRTVQLELSGAVGDWRATIPVEPENFVGTHARAIDAADTKHGITVAARLVARSEAGTSIELEAYFDPPLPVDDPRPARRRVLGLGTSGGNAPVGAPPVRRRLVIRDAGGHAHEEQGPSFTDPVARRHREVVTFPPLDVSSGMLEIPDVWTQDITDETVRLSVPGERDVNVAGCDAHVVVSRGGESGNSIRIDFTPRDEHAERQLLYLEHVVLPGGDSRGTIGMSINHCIGQRPYVNVPDPTGTLEHITMGGPVVQVRGPWTVRIPLAGRVAVGAGFDTMTGPW